MADFILFVSLIAVVFLAGYQWRKVTVENVVENRQEVRRSLLSKL